jgi:hypothetical protein
VAQEIAHHLKANLTSEEKKKLEKAPTNNPEAYKYYLQGYQLHVSYSKQTNRNITKKA